MDWTSTGDVHKRFKLFKQKCEFIFEGPLEGLDEKKQVRHLLLWVGDKGLEIYNTTTWTNDDDKDKTEKVLKALRITPSLKCNPEGVQVSSLLP